MNHANSQQAVKNSLDTALLHILQHSLGLNQYGQGNQYRNYYVAGGDSVAKCRHLVQLGFMVEREGTALTGGEPSFHVTRAGINAVAQESPKPPKLTRSQQRYRHYRQVADCYESFQQFLLYNYGSKKGMVGA